MIRNGDIICDVEVTRHVRTSKRYRSLLSPIISSSTTIQRLSPHRRIRNRTMRLHFNMAVLVVIVCFHAVSTNAWVLDNRRMTITISNEQQQQRSWKYASLTIPRPVTSSNNNNNMQQLSCNNAYCSNFVREQKSALHATVESNRIVVTSFNSPDDDDDDDDEEEEYTEVRQQDVTDDDDENFKDLNNAAMEHKQQQERENPKINGSTVPTTPTPAINSNSSDARRKSRNGNSINNNNNNKNSAFHDSQFLRKRTADLLKVTEDPIIVGTSSSNPPLPTLSSSTTTPQLGRHMKVEKKTFHFLLDAWAFSGEADAADQAMALLRRMEQLGQRSSTTTMNPIQPDVRSYTKAINAIARQASITGGDVAEALLEKMRSMFAEATHTDPEYAASIKPNSYTYTAVIQAHANSGAVGSPERAEALIERMIDKCQRGDDSVRPTAKTFNAIIHAYGKARNAERAAAVFNRMERLYESGVTEAKPNAINYNALITAWANCDQPDSAQRAETILQKMEGLYKSGDTTLQPTTVSFNAVIDACAKSGEENAAQRAEELLRRMYDLYEAGNVQSKPNTRSFNSVINAWAKSGDPNAASNAAELLELMEEKYEQGDTEVRPDVHSFCTTINAYARSGLSDKAERANKLYHEMKKSYLAGNQQVRPNVVAVNAVLNACAFTATGDDIRLQSRVVEIAHSILKELEQSPYVYGKPDQVTYGTFMKTCANQMPDSHTRQQIVEILFKKCSKAGQVGDLVLQQFRSMASEDIYQQLIGRSIHDTTIQLEDLPKEWTCNVVEGKWRRRRIQQS